MPGLVATLSWWRRELAVHQGTFRPISMTPRRVYEGGDNEPVTAVAPRVRRFGSAGHHAGNGPANHRHARFAQRHHDHRRQISPTAARAFGGTINLDAKDSKPYWPPNVVPPKGAPNVLLIMTDDQGYGVPAPSAASSRRRPWTASRTPDCVTRSSTQLLSARRAGGDDHWPQPSLGGLRRDRRNVHRIPGL